MSMTVKAQLDRSVESELKRILIVDDEPKNLHALSSALRSEGVEVITASKLEPAEEALSRYAFDVVIVDIRISGILGVEGLELLSYIKKLWPHTEVIAMTARGSSDIQQEAMHRGARCCYEKPVDIVELAEQINGLGIPVKR